MPHPPPSILLTALTTQEGHGLSPGCSSASACEFWRSGCCPRWLYSEHPALMWTPIHNLAKEGADGVRRVLGTLQCCMRGGVARLLLSSSLLLLTQILRAALAGVGMPGRESSLRGRVFCASTETFWVVTAPPGEVGGVGEVGGKSSICSVGSRYQVDGVLFWRPCLCPDWGKSSQGHYLCQVGGSGAARVSATDGPQPSQCLHQGRWVSGGVIYA